jgi:hypothetical protein
MRSTAPEKPHHGDPHTELAAKEYSKIIAHSCLQHHQRCDGRPYANRHNVRRASPLYRGLLEGFLTARKFFPTVPVTSATEIHDQSSCREGSRC